MHQSVDTTGQAGRTTPALVGRERERAALHAHLAAAVAGRGGVVLVGGEAGIGKTTLVRDLAETALSEGLVVLTGHCYDLTATPPYGPWLDLALRARSDESLPPPPILIDSKNERVTSQAELFAQVGDFLASVAVTRPALVILEDLHWADPASLDLLRHVARSLLPLRVLLVATYRVDELTRRHPFYLQIPALVHDAGGVRLDLRRLTDDQLRELIASRWSLTSLDEDRLVAYLDRRAEGNPFFAVELLRTLVEDGALAFTGQGWTLSELDRVAIPTLLRQVIDGRVARLGEETRQPLAIAAVIGQEIPLGLWASLCELTDEALLAIVERAVEANLLEATPDGASVRFAHALTREALYEGVMPPRRRLWHLKVGEALAASDPADPDAVAYHLRLAGDPRAWVWLERAGERAQRAYAWITATERLTEAACLLDGVSGQEGARARLLYRCGRLRRYADPVRGVDDLTEAERLARVSGDEVLAADAHYSRGLALLFADDFRRGLDEMAAGIEALEALPANLARSSWASAAWLADAVPKSEHLGEPDLDPAAPALTAAGLNHRRGGLPWFLAAAGRLDEAEAMAESFIATTAGLPAGGLTRSATGHANHALGIVHAARGRPDAARRALATARAIYDTLDHHAVIAFTLLCDLQQVLLPFATTDPAERHRVAAAAEEALRRAGGAFPPGLSPRRAWLGVHLLEGAWSAVWSIADDTPAHGNYYLRSQVTTTLATLAYHQAAPDAAWVQIRALLPQGPATEPGSCVLYDALVLQRLAVDLELDRGNLPAALAWLEANDRWLRWSGSLLGLAEHHLSWGRYLATAGDRGGAGERVALALGLASAPAQPLAQLAAHRLAADLACEGGDARAANEHVAAAVALADACAAPHERALSLLSLARLRAAEGRIDEAAALLTEIRDVCLALDAGRTITAADELAAKLGRRRAVNPGGLTQREVEVLRLVAEGLTDADVGERLFISPRTVSQHLRSIYSKLDVPSRAAATRLAVERGLI
jgi:DNA-binding CsgD family transcriptional regulator/tetratricopeptide (TPR) repeat protein